ncbi:MAG: hypothetical protein ACLPKB_35010 [Xanthobacteraceae bacterium]
MRLGAFSAAVELGLSENPSAENDSGGFRCRQNRSTRPGKWVLAFIALSVTVGRAVLASDDISGTYAQNRPCRGDGTDPKPLMVTITPDTIFYRGGVCSLSDRRQDENKISLHVTCTRKTGTPLSGDITLTLRADKNLDMVDQDKAYTAVLNRCPE